VRDTGIGIPRDKQERIFRAFEQEDTSTTRKYGGTGLGLTIASRLVALMDGTIKVVSEPNRGSTFAFTARFDRATKLPQPAVPQTLVEETTGDMPLPEMSLGPVRSLQVLVAEDNEFNAHLLEQLLHRRGHAVCLASDGREALRLAEEKAFDVLLLDIHMPHLDGFEVARAIREREQTAGGHLPIIALTARSRKEDREQCVAAGMDDFLAKPIQAADLWATIARVMNGSAPEVSPEPGLLDADVLLAACGSDPHILQKICHTFLARLPEHVKAIEEALKEGDMPRLREAAHKAAGMVGTFSTVAGEVASALEDEAAHGHLHHAAPLVDRLKTMAPGLMRLAVDPSIDVLRAQARKE
jgi:CheY-like chemotaxis protein